MPTMPINLAYNAEWADELHAKETAGTLIDLTGGSAPTIQVAVVPRGMASGKPSVLLRIDLEDGRTILAETSASLFATAGRAVFARYERELGE